MKTKTIVHKSAAPIYAAAVTWVLYALLFPLYQVGHFLLAAAASAVVALIARMFCRDVTETVEVPEEPVSTGNVDLDKAIAEGETLSYWGFGSQLYVNTTFFNELGSEIFENSGMSSFCVDISDTTLRQIFKIENLSYCNLHRTKPTDTGGEMLSYSTARAMRQLCRETGSRHTAAHSSTAKAARQIICSFLLLFLLICFLRTGYR